MTSHALSTDRQASAVQGWMLASTSWLAVIATSLLTPVLPKIAVYFAADPHVALKVSLVSTIPALLVALCAWPAGLLADRIGVRFVLLIGIGAYGFLGCAPMVLNSLTGVVVSRASVGIAEAIIMTCATALIGDYFHGEERDRWLALQTGGAPLIAIVMVLVGGMLGNSNWRFPFGVYGLAFIVFPLCLFKTWEPASHKRIIETRTDQTEAETEKFNWNPIFLICLLSFFASTSFYVLIVQLGFILTERGMTSGSSIGLMMAIASICMALGALLFKVLRLPVPGKLMVSFTLSAIGFFVIALSHSILFAMVGTVINGIGAGMILPTLTVWTLSKLTLEVRARGAGIWQASFFLGQFASPLIILGLKNLSGSESNAILIYAVFMTVSAAAAVPFYLQSRSQQFVEAE
jgi:MFS family permease